MKEKVTYKEAIEIVDRLTESKTKEARVRREELIKAIDAEIEAHTREIEKIEELTERIRAAWPVWKQLLQIWQLIRFGTLDSAKAIKELETKIRKLESTSRALMPVISDTKKKWMEYAGAIEITAKELLELAKIQKKSAAELLPLYDAAIASQRKVREEAAKDLKIALDTLTTRRQAQIKWNEAVEDPGVGKAYRAWIKESKELTKLEEERTGITLEIRKNLQSILEAEQALFAAREKRILTEEEYYKRTLSLMRHKQALLINTARQEEKWTKENAEEFIATQTKAMEAYHGLLDSRLQAALVANKTESEAIKDVQEVF